MAPLKMQFRRNFPRVGRTRAQGLTRHDYLTFSEGGWMPKIVKAIGRMWEIQRAIGRI